MKLILISALLLLTTLGCREGQKNEAPASIPILTSDYEVLDYTSTEASVEVSGQIALEGVNPLDFLEIYTNPFCQGSIVGTTTAQDFQLSGVELQLPVSLPVELYLSTANSSDCLLFGEFDPVVLEPVAPTFRQFSPESPSDSTWEPGIFGEAYPSSSSVSFFSDSTCTISVGDGSVEDFGSIGVQISLTPNALTSVYAKTIDPLGGESSCAEMGEFRHANSTLESPVFVTIDPASPNNTSNTPRVYGTSPLLTEEVRIYSDSGCLFLLNSGEPADFENDGIQLALPANTTNQIYAQAVDSLGNTSVCTFMTSYVFDTIGPANPSFTSVSPPSPTNTTTAPVLVGTGPSDSLTTQFFDSSLCLVQIGSGLTSAFGSTGLIASVGFNTTTDIYAKNFDAAGNDSDCILMTSYKHNTIPPEVPSFGGTDPVSPTNLTTDPLIFGTVATFTTSLDYYSDSGCVTMAGQGTTSEFEGAGVQVTLASNVVNEVYVRVWDLEGNVSACNFLGTYDHSNIPAPDVGFLMTFPASPTRSSTNPFVIGTADGTISQVEIFDDNLCTNSLGDGTRAQFASSGVQISVPANSTTNLFAR
ncbi:MAG: hypothetical protein HRT45_19735, partial [Bdellovibrionales bacterium]|nr:hypothetical protein [Bdellovibrionales bacterium]